MFFVFHEHNIQKWGKYRTKGVFLFCILYGLVMCAFFVGLKMLVNLLPFSRCNSIFSCILGPLIGGFVCGCFFGIAVWNENEKNYKKLVLKEDSDKKKQND
ncbi:MAG: hypothetical protein ACOX4D_00855 [Bacteroidales bacterium]|jgi:hypothetical protein